ncbi:MAG: rhodanese-like domain-containing protein [Nitrososphaerota archaeon]|jgi:rhodanese-related sulfurtransferase|nr:rhodanese-like domain-containing protein [Nitrososphaerota archaeon]
MIKSKIKKCLPIVTSVLILCLLANVLPLSVLGAEIQEPVTKNGATYANVITGAGNNGSNSGDKITANGATYNIKLDGEIVGSLVFNKSSQYIEIILTSDVMVDVLWNCASKYASCTLNGAGIYKIPQLIQDNGKPQNFNALWVTGVSQNGLLGSYQNLTVQEAKIAIDRNDFALIIDVRNMDEYELGHLYNAISMPLATIGNRTEELQAYRNSNILVYCGVGGRSAPAAQILTDNGFTNVYNMKDGLTEWMVAGYKIYTYTNYISVDNSENGKVSIAIEPYLLFQALCPCQNETAPEIPDIVDPTLMPENVELAMTTRTDTSIIVSGTFEVDGISFEMVYNRTLLWNYEKITGNCNRTAFLMSNEITVSSEGMDDITSVSYTISYAVRSDDYKVTLLTELSSLSEGSYERATTVVAYMPNDGTQSIVSKETVAFNSTVTLFETFQLLSDVCKEASKLYKSCDASELVALSQGYHILDNELNQFYNIAKQSIKAYDKPILNNSVTILDSVCSQACNIDCGILAGFACTALCLPIAAACLGGWPICLAACDLGCNGGSSVACGIICDYLCDREVHWDTMGCNFACGVICAIPNTGLIGGIGCGLLCGLACDVISGNAQPFNPAGGPTATYYVSSVYDWTVHGYGAVTNRPGLVGSAPDGSFVQLYGGNLHDGGHIVGYMDAVAHGSISVYGYSGTGYYTHFYVYVSNDYYNWSLVKVQTVYGDGSGTKWIDCGSFNGNFRYIGLAAIDDQGMSANMYIDAVSVIVW